jgi:hypothetical protein
MQLWMSRSLAGSLAFFAIACGTPPEQGPAEFEKPRPIPANTGQLTVHVKDMAKRLNLT